ncbi:MAG TPA: DUF4231 domain-containing protein [Sphingomicrobium sp.]
MTTPPRLPFVLSVGVTGHRSDALGGEGAAGLRERLMTALKLITDSALKTHADHGGWFTADPPRLQFITPLADGADQIAAECAIELGYQLHAVLPFDRDHYRRELSDNGALERFDALLEHCGCVLELPGDRASSFEAYVITGRATVAHCDLIIAVWDGLKPRGRGGTGDVVELAIARGTPVVHVPTDPARPARLLWAAFDPVVDTLGDDPMAERPLDAEHTDQVVRALLLPPPDPDERRSLATFENERFGRIRGRIEYPLLLAAAGVSRFDPRKFRGSAAAAAIEEEWRRFRAGCLSNQPVFAPLDLLEGAYSWADQLASHFAQTYRSGHIFNFVLGGVAVCLGLSAFMAPHAKFEFAAAEFLIALAIIVNTAIGKRHEWHRRWLDYRQLAERLRPMRSLKLLALAAPDPPGTSTNPIPRRWIDWYTSGVWRALGCPSGAINAERAAALASAVADYEIAPQVAYHEHHALEIETLDRRLEAVGSLLFVATLLVSIAIVVGLAFAPELTERYSNWATLVSAGFPALGTAVFGIRFQADFGGSAQRSHGTANALRQIEQELKKGVSLARACDLTEQGARRMLADLDEWRLVNQQRDLDVG